MIGVSYKNMNWPKCNQKMKTIEVEGEGKWKVPGLYQLKIIFTHNNYLFKKKNEKEWER